MNTPSFSSYGPLIFLAAALACPQAFAENAPADQPESPADFQKGEQVYQSSCAVCHDAGIQGAPRLGDAKAWKDRYFEWLPVMNKHASSGYLNMPAKGRDLQLSDQEVANAVFYMTEKLKGH